MALRRLSGTDCYDGDTCPTIYQRDLGTVIVQGYIVMLEFLPGRSAVAIPTDVMVNAAKQLQRGEDNVKCGAGDQIGIYPREAGTVIVQGVTVLASELAVPEGEAAVAIPAAVLVEAAERAVQRVA